MADEYDDDEFDDDPVREGAKDYGFEQSPASMATQQGTALPEEREQEGELRTEAPAAAAPSGNKEGMSDLQMKVTSATSLAASIADCCRCHLAHALPSFAAEVLCLRARRAQ